MLMKLGSYAMQHQDEAAVSWLRSLPARLLKAEQPMAPLLSVSAATPMPLLGHQGMRARATNARKGVARKLTRSELLNELKTVLGEVDYKAAKKLIKPSEIFDKMADITAGTNSLMELMGHVAVVSSRSGARERPYYIARCRQCSYYLACKQLMVGNEEYNEWFEMPAKEVLARCIGALDACFDDEEEAASRMPEPEMRTSAAASSSCSAAGVSMAASVAASVGPAAAAPAHTNVSAGVAVDQGVQQDGWCKASQHSSNAEMQLPAATVAGCAHSSAPSTMEQLLAALAKDGNPNELLQRLVAASAAPSGAAAAHESVAGSASVMAAAMAGSSTAEKRRAADAAVSVPARKRFIVDPVAQQPQNLDSPDITEPENNGEESCGSDEFQEPSLSEAEAEAAKQRSVQVVMCVCERRVNSG